MDPKDLDYFLRTGQLPTQSETKESTSTESQEEEMPYYSYNDYESAKTDNPWKDSEKKIPFIISLFITICLLFMDLVTGAAFDLNIIVAALINWFILYMVLLLMASFLRWASKFFQ